MQTITANASGLAACPMLAATPSQCTLRFLFWQFPGRILLVYVLFSLETGLRLVQPLALGLAINDLLRSSFVGLAIFIAQHLAYLVIGSIQRAYDTRVFASIYTELAAQSVQSSATGA